MKFPPAPPEDAVKFCDFVTASPTPFHAVANLSKRLLRAGFAPLTERTVSASSLAPGGSYFYTRNQSSIVAFTLPAEPSPSTSIAFAVGHADSPCLKLRPVSKRSKLGYLQAGVELYGGGIWHSWFDRDLSIAGRVIVANASDAAGGSSSGQAGGGYTSRLVKIDRPIMRIPTLAIHLDRTANDSFKFNKESEFLPILGLAADILNGPPSAAGDADDEAKGMAQPAPERPSRMASPSPIPFSGAPSRLGTPQRMDVDGGAVEDVAGMSEKHHPLLLAVLADELGCAISDIQDFELSLYDTQPSCVGGLSNEFVFSPRIDNLMTSFCSIEGLAQAVEAEALAPTKGACPSVRCVILFDNEEVGSVSHHGAESNLLPAFVELVTSLPGLGSYYATLANSFLVSADMGHAVNPNYADRYEANHAPRINGGVVIKTNANQRYTSNAQTTFLLRRIAKRAGVRTQEFEIRNDSLSMHSIRETAGSGDVKDYIRLFKTYFEVFDQVERDLRID